MNHPNDARYYSSRAAARTNKLPSEKIIRLGQFQAGSFNCYPRMKSNGLYVGQLVGPGGSGPIPSVIIWMTTKKV